MNNVKQMKTDEVSKLVPQLMRESDAIRDRIEEWRCWWNELCQLGRPKFGEMGCTIAAIRQQVRMPGALPQLSQQ